MSNMEMGFLENCCRTWTGGSQPKCRLHC